ncbi:MAG: hypothetical protein U0T69_06110 [Chitinophagales bacterium]
MKKLIKNILLLSSILLLISLIFKFILPFYWGDTTQATKFEYYKKNSNKFNAVYLGGSLEYRHLDPVIIDSIAKKNGIDLHSYNMGIDGHGIIQQMTDLEGILKIENPNLKYVFLSVSSDPYFYPLNMHTTKWIAWQDVSSTYRAVKTIATLNDPIRNKAKFSYYYGLSWIENIFKIGAMPDVINYEISKNDTNTDFYLGKDKNGFYPYDEEMNNLMAEYKWQDTMLVESKRVYEREKGKRDSLTASVVKAFENYKSTDKPNKAMVNLLMDAYKKCIKKGIQVYFMLPPRARTDYSLLLPVFYAMPANSQIAFADPRKYPKYYDVNYGYNFHHLNHKGAVILSNDFGNQLSKLIISTRDSI